MEKKASTLTEQFAALSHPQRLAVFRLLVRRCPDALPAGEIAEVLGHKASTLSVYLAALTRVGLISQTRRGTSLLYALDTKAAQGLVSDLFLDCCRGRPDLCPPIFHPLSDRSQTMRDRSYNVLFICTGNSVRSIFAEAILRDVAGDRFNAHSAGTRPGSELNPMALEILAAKGIPTGDLRAKNVDEFQGPEAPTFDFVFTVCDRAANEECPAWQGQPISAHWGLPDPVKATGSAAERSLAFQQTYAMMRHRIIAFAALPLDALDRVSLQNRVDDIGREKETA
ncbi:helix-turn-helix domain-containing protein [Marinovum algicola]|uniref:arsenate reductase/protein-tyrosine-phosphatase family protein n=1 Tax=Marinovum algicola TaxID=42444 RepID=UPI0024BB01AF|nr:helix-turn-helix domain-containing protein [Marinovum algicola]